MKAGGDCITSKGAVEEITANLKVVVVEKVGVPNATNHTNAHK
jgi:hypothetical protein